MIIFRKIILSIFLFFIIPSDNIFSQEAKEEKYPKADIHIGSALTKGTYIGSTVQVSKYISLEASYGAHIGFFLAPTDLQRISSVGVNYHLWCPLFLNCAYTFKEQLSPGYFKSHIIGANIGLLSLRNTGFHFVVSVGSYYEYEDKYKIISRAFKFNANVAIGFTFL